MTLLKQNISKIEAVEHGKIQIFIIFKLSTKNPKHFTLCNESLFNKFMQIFIKIYSVDLNVQNFMQLHFSFLFVE